MEWTDKDEKLLSELKDKREKVYAGNMSLLARMIDDAGGKEFLGSEIETIRAFLMEVEADDLQAIMTVIYTTPK